jgi:hypothetical protein
MKFGIFDMLVDVKKKLFYIFISNNLWLINPNPYFMHPKNKKSSIIWYIP